MLSGIVIQVSRCEVFNVVSYGDCLKASAQWLTLLFLGWICHSDDIHFLSTLQQLFTLSQMKMDVFLAIQGNDPFIEKALQHGDLIFANC